MSKKLTSFSVMGSLVGGTFIPNNPRYLSGMLHTFDDNKRVRVTYEAIRSTRSRQQNNYYFGVVLQLISEHTGFTVEELHELFRSKFLRTKRVWRGGEMTVLRSTTQLNSTEFGEYLAEIIREAGELEIEIPEADKDWDVIHTSS